MFQRNTELLKILVTANDEIMTVPRGGLRTAATPKVELFVPCSTLSSLNAFVIVPSPPIPE